MSRLVDAVRLRTVVARHRGDAVTCPICEHDFDAFKDDWNRSGALCWRCGSHERHRAQWLLLQRRPELLRDARSLLHFAPEWCISRRLRAIPGRAELEIRRPGSDASVSTRGLCIRDCEDTSQ